MLSFDVKFKQTDQRFAVGFNSDKKAFNIGFKDVQVVTEPTAVYEGDYSIVPTVDGQVLPTKEKKMRDDLTVKGIPVYEVSNPKGGTTLYIASEVEIEMEG